MTSPVYRKLAKRRSIGRSADLWLADDHLLFVDRRLFTENYRRFRLSEIQSIVMVERTHFRIVQIAALVLTLALLVLVAMFPESREARIWWSVPLLMIGAAQIVDLVKGHYCRVVLRTAASTVPLKAISRMKKARRFLDTMEPLIAQAQAGIGPPAIPMQDENVVVSKPPEIPAEPTGPLPYVMFGCVILTAVFGLLLLFRTVAAEAAPLSWTVALAAFGIGVAVVSGSVGKAPGIVRMLAVVIMLVAVVDVVFTGAGYFAGTMEMSSQKLAQPPPPPGWFSAWIRTVIGVEVTLGVVGLLVTYVTRRR